MVKIKTYEEQLAEVQAAITDILSGAQEASYNGQRVRRADLDMLTKYEEQLRQKIKNEQRGGIRVRYAVPK